MRALLLVFLLLCACTNQANTPNDLQDSVNTHYELVRYTTQILDDPVVVPSHTQVSLDVYNDSPDAIRLHCLELGVDTFVRAGETATVFFTSDSRKISYFIDDHVGTIIVQ